MRTVSKSVLEGNLLKYLRQVEETGEALVVTDHGRPVVRVVPIRAVPTRTRTSSFDAFADVRGRVVYREAILAPTIDEWPEA